MVAGAGLNDREAVEFVIERAPESIDRLVELGVPFNKDSGDLHLTREGGHSHRRIVHVDDATGWAVQEALLNAAKASPNITMLGGRTAIDLITDRNREHYSGAGHVWGVYALNEETGRVERHLARATILAAGGAGRVYQFSTAPRGATGDGIAMAWRAGSRVSNMEMMQFHPTCLYNLEVKNFLITEAVRGEGGRLFHPETGHRFMADYDKERMELAPRDVVARAIDDQIKRFGLDYVHLDIIHQQPEFVRDHFPTIHEKLMGLGIDMTKSRSPLSRHSITLAAGSWWICTHALICPAFGRRANAPRAAFTGPTGWRPTAYSNALYSARRPQGIFWPNGTNCLSPPRSCHGTKAGCQIRTSRW